MVHRPYIGMSMSRKVNLGKFESADCHLSINGITVETAEAEIDALLQEQGQLAYSKMIAVLKERIKDARGL